MKHKLNLFTQAHLSDFTQSDLQNIIETDSDEGFSDWAKSVASVFDGANQEDQPDLLKMRSILVSEGMNLNDDVFLREELMQARSTGAHKPVNLEHQDADIVGHMVRTYASDKQGHLIEGEALPQEPVDIINDAVVYSYIFPEVAAKVKSMAGRNELFVSVEAWFESYDYLVGNKIVRRTDQTSPIFDPTLRMMGGEGYYQGEKLGRVLRNIRFGGIGIVAVPANPESLILEAGTTTNEEAKSVEKPALCSALDNDIQRVIAENTLGYLENQDKEACMEDNSNADALQASNVQANDVQTDEAGSDNSCSSESVESCNEADSNCCQESAKAKLEAKEGAFNSVVGGIAALLEDTVAEMQEVDKQIVLLQNESLVIARKQSLVKAGLKADSINKRIEKVVSMSDEQFGEYVEEVKDILDASSEEVNSEEGQENNKEEVAEGTQPDTLVEEVAEEVAEVVETEVSAEETDDTEELSAVETEAVQETAEVVVEEVVVEETAPEVAQVATEDIVEETVEVAVETPAEEATVETEILDEVSEEVVEVQQDESEEVLDLDLETIVPVSPEIALPSDIAPTFNDKLEEAILDIFKQRRGR